MSFWTNFCPFTSLRTWKIKIWNNEKTTWRYYHFAKVQHNWQSYNVWFLRYQAQQTEFFVILDHFLPFYLPNNPRNINFEKIKKTPGDITILHMCTISDNHMMYGSWDIERDRQNFLLFWIIFCPFTPPMNPENQNLKKMKKAPEDFTNVYHKWQSWCTVPEIWSAPGRIFCHLEPFFAILPL